jgi:hypothetical protein
MVRSAKSSGFARFGCREVTRFAAVTDDDGIFRIFTTSADLLEEGNTVMGWMVLVQTAAEHPHTRIEFQVGVTRFSVEDLS